MAKTNHTKTSQFIISCLLTAALLTLHTTTTAAQESDKDRLAVAIDYFQGRKYHEALIILQQLDKKYNLNPRYRAYMGICFYKEQDYKSSCEYLDSVMTDIEIFSPEERSTYYFSDAESHFNMEEYQQAVDSYERLTTVCHDNEKADAFYKMALCYIKVLNWNIALEYLQSAYAYYDRYTTNDDRRARMRQIRNMISGCRKHINADY